MVRKKRIALRRISPLSVYLKEIVYGGNDGIVTTFAVVAGFTGAQQQISQFPLFALLVFGFANLFSDALSLALGNFLAVHAERDVYAHESEQEQNRLSSQADQEELITQKILVKKGFTPDSAKELLSIYKKNPRYWVEFLLDHKEKLPNPQNENALLMSLATFLAFCSFGVIPLLPYILLPSGQMQFQYSILTTGCGLLFIGIARFLVTRQHWLRSIGETILLGSTAALVAFCVGTLIGA